MLKIFNDLEPFFRDCNRKISVREYARLRNVSPPSASTLLENLHKEGLLKKEKFRNYIFYYADTDGALFRAMFNAYNIAKKKR